jgi:hypothetical protein
MARTHIDYAVLAGETDGYRLLIAAVLRQAVQDARGRGGAAREECYEAQAFLQHARRVAFWAELAGTDGTTLRQALCRAAGLRTHYQRVPWQTDAR